MAIQDVKGSLGRALQHTLLWTWPGNRWPYLEEWDLDWAATNPDGYLAHHAPKWLPTAAASTLLAEDLDLRRP